MRFQHVIEAVYFRPWCIMPARWLTIHQLLQSHLAKSELPQPKAEDGETDFFGNALPKMEITPNAVAIIPVKGTLMQHAGMLEKMCGACSYDDIKANLQLCLDQDIENAVLDISSPGGEAVGMEEACDAIDDARMNGMTIRAYSDTLVCSAAYDLACECDEVLITATAFCGSVGALLAVIDCSEQFAQAGLKLEMFASGKYKGAGVEGVELTDDHKDYFNSLKDKFAGMFKINVRENRPDVDEESMEGQAFIGSDAVDSGLADEIVGDLEDVLERFR